VQLWLKKIEIKKNRKDMLSEDDSSDVVLFGFDRVGSDFINAFTKLDQKFVVVDLNPELIKQMETSNVPFKYGDAEDVEFLQELQLKNIKMCVSTIPYFKVNKLLLKKIREENQTAIIIVRSHDIEETKELYELGATYVVMPHYLGAQYATNMIAKHGLNIKGFEEERAKHLLHVNKS
jgi:Trk K+ transport system NAD-binding subunit